MSERIITGQHSIIGDPGAARTARLWWFPAANTTPNGSDQELVFFNPQDEPAMVHISIGKLQGGCCAKSLTVMVPSAKQFTYRLGTSPMLSGPLSILASSVVAVERVAVGENWSSLTTIPGTVVTSRHWYLPDALAGQRGSSAVVFNANASALKVSITVVSALGPASVVQRSVAGFSETVIPLTGAANTVQASVELDANGPITGGLITSRAAHQSSIYLGSTGTSQHWMLMSATAGQGSSESVTILNPGKVSSTVTIHVLHGNIGPTLKVTVPAHARVVRVIDGLVAAAGSVITVDASARL